MRISKSGKLIMAELLAHLGLNHLSADQRLQLVGELWDSLASTSVSVPLSDAQRAELQIRLEIHNAQPLAGTPWPEVRERLTGSSE